MKPDDAASMSAGVPSGAAMRNDTNPDPRLHASLSDASDAEEATAAAAAPAGVMGMAGPSLAKGVDEITDTSRMKGPQTPPPDAYLNTVVADRYRILRKLGEGGMGAVYLAEHVMIERKVALKVLSQDFARKEDLVKRFIQEARAAAHIGHQNIVEVYDFGETETGSVFFAMEYLEGKDLAQLVRESAPLPAPRVRNILMQICLALDAAHKKKIIHRDLKPENIFLIDREGRSDFVKVLDFGIAKISNLEDGGAGMRLTKTGMIFGTPEYMSPEQARGESPDHRVDIYAVGCILYEMLTGNVPFAADTFMGVLTKHMFEPLTPPSQRCRTPIAPDIEAICMRALDKDRDRRFQTMQDVAQALSSERPYDSVMMSMPSMDSRSLRVPMSGLPQQSASHLAMSGSGVTHGLVYPGSGPGPGGQPMPLQSPVPGQFSGPYGVPGMAPPRAFRSQDQTTQSQLPGAAAHPRRKWAILVGAVLGLLAIAGFFFYESATRVQPAVSGQQENQSGPRDGDRPRSVGTPDLLTVPTANVGNGRRAASSEGDALPSGPIDRDPPSEGSKDPRSRPSTHKHGAKQSAGQKPETEDKKDSPRGELKDPFLGVPNPNNLKKF